MNATEIAVRPDGNPRVFARDGQVFADSRDVAEHFGKRHDDVLKKVRKLIAEGVRNFAEASYTAPESGATAYPYFTMDRDAFVLLAMSFTGAKALRWKMLYITAFNAMEAELRSRTAPPVLNDPAALRTLLLGYTEQVIELRAENAVMAPKAAGFDRIATADGPMCITDTAKALQVAPKALFRFLSEHGWTYRRASAGHLVGYQIRVAAGLLTHKVTTVTRPDGTEKVVEHVLVTPRGLAKLAQQLGQQQPAATGGEGQ